MTLPSPVELTSIGTGIAVCAGLVVWLLKDVTLALYLGVASAALFLAAGVAHTYKQQGVDEQTATDKPVIAKLTAEVTDLTARVKAQADYAAQVLLAQDKIRQDADDKAKADHDATVKKYETLLARARADAPAHAIPVPAASAGVLDDAISAANAPDTGPAAAQSGANPATAPADTTAGALIEWGVQCTALYKDAVKQVGDLQDLWNNTRAAQLKLQPLETP